MFTVKLAGGLCNTMFQIAWAESASKKYGIDVCYANLEEHFDTISKLSRSPHAKEYLKVFPNLDWYKNKEHRNDKYVNKYVPFHYTLMIPQGGVCYIGYFQSEKYFYDRDFIVNLFEPNRAIKQFCINACDLWGSCFIHVRRSDYLGIPDYHPNCTMDYYNRAIEVIKQKGVNQFLIFSDDLPWCRNHFVGDGFVFIDEWDFFELFLMTYCDHAIISNSTFPWWGAWLGNIQFVIAPKRWLGDAAKQNDNDVVPEGWLKI